MKPLFQKPTRKEKVRKPLKRSRMKRKTSRRVQQKTEEAKRYQGWIASLPCVVEADSYSCNGPIQVAHMRNLDGLTGMSRKPDEFEVLPMCMFHHDSHDNTSGYFRGWGRDKLRHWARTYIQIAFQNYRYDRTFRGAA